MSRPRTPCPTLSWPGRAAAEARADAPCAPLAPCTERHGAADAAALGRLIRQDNRDALGALLAAGEAPMDLIYADPPFATGLTFAHKPTLGETRHAADAFVDAFPGGLNGWLDVMYPRLVAMHAALAETGSLYLHLDANTVHHARVLLDEIFGPACFQREIVWRIGWLSGFKTSARNWIRNHDTILYYVKTPGQATFNKAFLPHAPGYLRRDGKPPTGRGIPLEDVWNAQPADVLDSIQIKSLSTEKTGYPTQKNEALLERIITASSAPGERVCDPFGGSGTAAVVAHRLGRRFVSIDVGAAALAVSRARLLNAGAAFTVHDAGPVDADAGPYALERSGDTLRVTCPAGAPALDQVYAGPQAMPFVPSAHALRGRVARGLDEVRLAVGGRGPLTVQLVDVDGRTRRVSLD
jgi:DNA modification methylase